MLIIPAIDLLDGKVVRLTQGKREAVTVYSQNPIEVAKRWEKAGAQWLHIVDLNGALEGDYKNLPIAEQIMQECSLNIELSGGIRNDEILNRCLEAGAERIILGTKACEDPEFIRQAAKRYGEKIAVAIDARAGQVLTRGWLSSSGMTPAQLAKNVLASGVECLVCTDVSRDGMLQGPNMALLEEILNLKPKKLIASGGISSLEDLKKLKKLKTKGLIGAIVGKALYEGTIDFAKASSELN